MKSNLSRGLVFLLERCLGSVSDSPLTLELFLLFFSGFLSSSMLGFLEVFFLPPGKTSAFYVTS